MSPDTQRAAALRRPAAVPIPAASYAFLLDRQIPFAFSRWGDGEWAAILGHTGATCDGQIYSGALRTALTHVLTARPPYLLGLQSLAMQHMGGDITDWLARRQLRFPWVDADTFALASLDGSLSAVLDALRARGVVLIGPDHLQTLALFPVLAHVRVPVHDGFGACDVVTQHAVNAVQAAPDPAVVAISAGPVAKILVDRLARRWPGRTIIDFGSLWEPYVGLATRTYHQRVLQRVRRERMHVDRST